LAAPASETCAGCPGTLARPPCRTGGSAASGPANPPAQPEARLRPVRGPCLPPSLVRSAANARSAGPRAIAIGRPGDRPPAVNRPGSQAA